jgi:hypothetical protein
MPLKVSAGIGAWIDDFKKSDAPQFKGKSDKERRDQAIAAYLSAKRGDKNEDVSELAMKTDPKIPNLKSPKDKKYNRQKPLSTYKQAKKSGQIRKEQQVDEETNFQVNIEGLPMMFMSGMGPGEIKQKLRKIVKQPSMIQSVKRVTDADVKKTFRLKAQGRDDEEEQMDEALKHTHAVIDGNGKVAGMSSDEKGAKDIARRHNGRVVKLKKPISSRKGDMMINRPFSEAKLDELSPATMNRYKKAAADDLHKSFNKGISIVSKPKTKKDKAALDKRMDKRKAGLNRAARITGTHGQQDEK